MPSQEQASRVDAALRYYLPAVGKFEIDLEEFARRLGIRQCCKFGTEESGESDPVDVASTMIEVAALLSALCKRAQCTTIPVRDVNVKAIVSDSLFGLGGDNEDGRDCLVDRLAEFVVECVLSDERYLPPPGVRDGLDMEVRRRLLQGWNSGAPA